MINSIIYLYSNGNKNINNIKKEESNNIVFNNNNKRDSKNFIQFNNKTNNNNEDQNYGKDLNEIYYDKNYIIKNISDINLDPEKTTDSFKNTTNNIDLKNILNKSRKESKNVKLINNLISQISNNIEIIFLNSIKLILEYQEIIDKLVKEIKASSNIPYKKTFKKKSTKYIISSNNSSMLNSMCVGENQLNEKIIKMLQNEKNKYKYRMCYLKSFVYKYIAIITQTAENIYNNLDQWIVTNVSLQNDSLNIVISLLKNKLKNHRLINEKKEINTIEMDKFEKMIDDNVEGGGSEIGLKPIDNSSVGIGRIYNKINIDYLINDSFNDIKVEEIITINQNEEKNEKKKSILEKDKIENKKYKIIFPNELDKSINSSINNSFGAGAKNRLKEIDFYFDINKFNAIYKNIKKYEIEENIISKDLFYEIFIKQCIIDKYLENINEIEKQNINLGIKNINPIEKISNKNNNEKLKNTSKDSEEEDYNINSINEHLINNQNNYNSLNAICPALKMLNTKQFNKIYKLYNIPIEHKAQANNDRKESINENLKEEKDYNINEKENNEKEKDNNQNINKEENKIEYDVYLNTSEIFTILPLIGCKIMNIIEETKIMNDLKDKMIRGKYLSKKDFIEYKFWFEQEFEYQNEDLAFQQILEENIISPSKKSNLGLEMENKNKKINIKESLFDIWKDEKGDKIDFQKFISVLKSNKYITDLNGFNEENYYSIIFKSEN